MDLNRLNTQKLSNEGAWMTVVDIGTGEETDIQILLAGVDSDHFREAKKDWDRRRREKLEKGKGLPTAEELEKARLAMLVTCTLDWRNLELEGKPLACTKAAANHVYRNFPWLREQADQFIEDRRNFLPPEARGEAVEPTPDPEAVALSDVDAYAAEVGNGQSAGQSGDSA